MKENRFTTDLPEMMVGMYAAEDIRRHWTEEVVDEDAGEDAGEVTPVDRSELVLQTVTSFKECIVIEREFTEEEMRDADGNPIERAFYQLDTVAAWRDGDFAESHIFIALARDVDEARAQVEDWINSRANKRMQQLAADNQADGLEYKRLFAGFDLSVIAGTKIPCTATVPAEQSKDFYAEQEENTKNQEKEA